MTARVLILDDDPTLCRVLEEYLRAQGHTATSCLRCEDLPADLSNIDVVVVDVVLPDGSGIDMVAQIRGSNTTVGLILMSGLADEPHRVAGLQSGADDYCIKPLCLAELELKVRNLSRRVQADKAIETSVIEYHDVELDCMGHCLRSGNTVIALTGHEFLLALSLFKAGGQAVSREALNQLALHRIWRPGDRSLDTLAHRLRRKIQVQLASNISIRSVRGRGYTLSLT